MPHEFGHLPVTESHKSNNNIIAIVCYWLSKLYCLLKLLLLWLPTQPTYKNSAFRSLVKKQSSYFGSALGALSGTSTVQLTITVTPSSEIRFIPSVQIRHVPLAFWCVFLLDTAPVMMAEADRRQNMDRMKELMTFNKKSMYVLKALIGPMILTSALVTASGMSSNFTGMCGAEMAAEYARAGGWACGIPVQLDPVLAGDANELSRDMALAFSPHSVVVDNILEFFEIAYWSHSWPWEAKWNMLLQSPLKSRVWDYRRNAYAEVPAFDVDFSGSPCVDFSSANAFCREVRNGRFNHCFLGWAAFHLRHQTKVMLHENVPNFDSEWAILLLGTWYFVCILEVKPGAAGFNMTSRKRQVLVFVLKSACVVTHDISQVWEAVSSSLATGLTLSVLNLAPLEEVRREELEACCEQEVLPRMSTDLSYCLHVTLRKYIRTFDWKYFLWSGGQLPHQDANIAYNLQDNPQNRLTWSLWES